MYSIFYQNLHFAKCPKIFFQKTNSICGKAKTGIPVESCEFSSKTHDRYELYNRVVIYL